MIAIAFNAMAPKSWSLATSAGIIADRTGRTDRGGRTSEQCCQDHPCQADRTRAHDDGRCGHHGTAGQLRDDQHLAAIPAIGPGACLQHQECRRETEREHHETLHTLAAQQPVEHQPAEHESLGVGDEEERHVVEPQVPVRRAPSAGWPGAVLRRRTARRWSSGEHCTTTSAPSDRGAGPSARRRPRSTPRPRTYPGVVMSTTTAA